MKTSEGVNVAFKRIKLFHTVSHEKWVLNKMSQEITFFFLKMWMLDIHNLEVIMSERCNMHCWILKPIKWHTWLEI